MGLKIGDLYHVIHLTDLRSPLDAWYDSVFLPRRGVLDADYFAGEQRDASLVALGDCIIEVMAPSRHVEGWDAMPIGRFYKRFGRHWHSIAWYVDDVGDAWAHLRDHGLRVIRGGGPGTDDDPPGEWTPIFTHPKETITQLQFMKRRPRRSAEEFAQPGEVDPRYLPGWSSSWWAMHHPLGLVQLAYLVVVTADLDRAVAVYVDGLGGNVVAEGQSALTGTDDVAVAIGSQTVIQLSRPLAGSSLAGADLDKNGDMLHAVAFEVSDLQASEDYLVSKGIGLAGRDDQTILVDPADTFGAPFRFTTARLRRDERERSGLGG